ncbi:MAG: Glucans biosynthesis protein C [Bacteroidetes bacterium ADurb.Bin141]|nr:MAG: Glucans biosynthesis protein C [Bacteroidetes bacterium ADurb.Bin141]
MSEVKRINFLDHLRAFIILLVILLHTSMAYLSTEFPGWAHNREKNDALAYLMMTLFDSPFLMVVMFFIAGYFTLPSLIKKGPKVFLKDKLIHIGIPFLAGATAISATLGAIAYFSDGNTEMNFIQCFLAFFLPKNYGQYHFWFLGVLLYFFILTVPVIKLTKLSPGNINPGKPSFMFFIVFIMCTTLTYFAVGSLTGSYMYWIRFYLFHGYATN